MKNGGSLASTWYRGDAFLACGQVGGYPLHHEGVLPEGRNVETDACHIGQGLVEQQGILCIQLAGYREKQLL